MQITKERLYHDDNTAYPFVPSVNIGGPLTKRLFIVIHSTEGQSAQAAIEWLSVKKSRVSSHLVIGRDGAVTQLVPFNVIAWHAGQSYWEGYKYLNIYSIGIELDNAGKMTRINNQWVAAFKKVYPDNEVMQATHKFGVKPAGWHIFTPEQIQATVDVCKLLVKAYGITEIIGHDDISPKQKWDPGPAFPMDQVRAQVFPPPQPPAPAQPPTT
ncbi:MAG: N-acetylmuramoyl-L-alanine amidase [Chloroflexi bacterium]|nr:N-acetylmuramoyl-L-alanine amidase [Chloroflexota bacterium]MBI3339708.1 N-acetylmuramoyl-L-alanine amidase [Chloroflexota bacterium]